jgi:hypothetical protein
MNQHSYFVPYVFSYPIASCGLPIHFPEKGLGYLKMRRVRMNPSWPPFLFSYPYPFFQSVVVCMAAGSLVHEASGSAFQICLVLKKCYSNFSSVNRNIVSYCLSLCIDRNVTGYFTPSGSVLYTKWFENRQTIQEIVRGTLKQFLMFCHFMRFSDEYALECWRISSVGSPREFSIYFYSCFSHCEACFISFLLLAHRSHLMIFRLHLIFRLSSIKSLC